jgi:protein SCO1/2/putative membrane protein
MSVAGLFAGAFLLLTFLFGRKPLEPHRLWRLEPFELLGADGRPVRLDDLARRPWIADFIFTRCVGPCPEITLRMSEMARVLPREFRFVSFSVDPEVDTPDVLREYAQRFGADPDRWLFLTGKKDDIRRVVQSSFKLPSNDPQGNPEHAILHSLRFVLVDAEGTIRGVYQAPDEHDREHLRGDALALVGKDPFSARLRRIWPAGNATLNGLSGILLTVGFAFIRAKRVNAHRACMGSAFVLSVLFLASYLAYHSRFGSTPFHGEGGLRLLYRSILFSHMALAATVPVLAGITIVRAMRGRFERHKKIARWTLPIWLYVSVTGVIVYGMLYHVNPPAV